MRLALAGLLVATAASAGCAADGLTRLGVPLVEVAVSPALVPSGDSVHVTVALSNRSPIRERFDPGTACYLDFEVRDSLGTVIGRGVEGCILIVVGPITLEPGEVRTAAFTWRVRVRDIQGLWTPAPPGAYVVRGLLHAAAPLQSGPVGLRVVAP